jgi:hypothetical protein
MIYSLNSRGLALGVSWEHQVRPAHTTRRRVVVGSEMRRPICFDEPLSSRQRSWLAGGRPAAARRQSRRDQYDIPLARHAFARPIDLGELTASDRWLLRGSCGLLRPRCGGARGLRFPLCSVLFTQARLCVASAVLSRSGFRRSVSGSGAAAAGCGALVDAASGGRDPEGVLASRRFGGRPAAASPLMGSAPRQAPPAPTTRSSLRWRASAAASVAVSPAATAQRPRAQAALTAIVRSNPF